MFDFCACANIKRVPGYKETDPDVQFVDNYLYNRASVPPLRITSLYNLIMMNSACFCIKIQFMQSIVKQIHAHN